jgi:SAM-dependent methyltransferase
MLDVGSGIGRKTLALTKYLTSAGRYEGIEIVAAGVEWCTRHITSRYPNFQFTRMDIRSDLYNPDGAIAPTEVRFPFDDESFDFVMLGSVFTHMLEPELDHYLSEILRVLRPEGKALVTYFLLNDDSRAHLAQGKGDFTFDHERGSSYLNDVSGPLAAVAYDEAFMRSRYAAHRFKVLEPVYLGTWCGRPAVWSNEYGNYQDIIVASKRARR